MGSMELPIVELDYNFFAKDGTGCDQQNATVTVISAYDKATSMGTATVVLAKNENLKFVQATINAFLDQIGHVRARLRTDGEPVIPHNMQPIGLDSTSWRRLHGIVASPSEG